MLLFEFEAGVFWGAEVRSGSTFLGAAVVEGFLGSKMSTEKREGSSSAREEVEIKVMGRVRDVVRKVRREGEVGIWDWGVVLGGGC